jgi:hypothetical protein
VTALLRRAGQEINSKRVQRIRRKEGLQVSRRQRKLRRLGLSTAERQRATQANHVWSWDFVEDQTENGTRFRVLTLIDEYTRECLAVHVDWSIRAVDGLWWWKRRGLSLSSGASIITPSGRAARWGIKPRRSLLAAPSAVRYSGRATPSLRPELLNQTSNQWQNSTYDVSSYWGQVSRSRLRTWRCCYHPLFASVSFANINQNSTTEYN